MFSRASDKRVFADVGEIDLPVRIVHGHRDADAARAGAQVERVLDARDRRATARKPLWISSAIGERGTSARWSDLNLSPANHAVPVRYATGLLLVDAAIDQVEHALLFLGRQSRLSVRGRQIVRQVQRVQHQVRRFVDARCRSCGRT